MVKFDFYSMSESGHRLEYIKFSEVELGGSRVFGWDLLKTKRPLLFLMVEESFFLYVLVALIRSLLGRRTVGLIFRGRECVQRSSLRLKVKYWLMRTLKRINNIRSISIVPFYVTPKIENICDDWIYDFQFWDKDFLESLTHKEEVDKAVKLIEAQAKGRKIICAIGKQDKSKGFDQFLRLYLSSEVLREKYLFVSGGKINGIDESLVSKFEGSGGLLINKRISDSELVALYKVANVIWACYSPDYDQSSGVLGRALQYEKAVIVRGESIAEKLSKKYKSPVYSIVESDFSGVLLWLKSEHGTLRLDGSTSINDKGGNNNLKILLNSLFVNNKNEARSE
ncbi:MAG: hypothetical protein RPR97_19305 [Colwellia sp.]